MAKKTAGTKECIQAKRQARIAVRGEHNRSAIFLNPKLEPFRLIRVDGCLVQSALAADWMLSRSSGGDLVIELKGRDVGHALFQVFATMMHWERHELRAKKSLMSALIVCAAQRPALSPQVQRARRELRARFSADLTIRSGNREYDFASLFPGNH